MAKISAEEKLEAVQRYLKEKESARAVAADLGVSHRYLLTWVKQYEHNNINLLNVVNSHKSELTPNQTFSSCRSIA